MIGQKTPLFPSDKEFISLVEDSQYADAIHSVIGVNRKGLKLSRRLLANLSLLTPDLQRVLVEWSDNPLDENDEAHAMAIAESDRWIVKKVLRHEIAHAVVAREYGFETGDIEVTIDGPDGSHRAKTVLSPRRETKSISDILRYLDERIVVLMAGTMAEAESSSEIGQNFDVAFQQADSDYGKAMELLRLSLNMQSRLSSQQELDAYELLKERARTAVTARFPQILDIVDRLASRVSMYGRGAGYSTAELAVWFDA